MQLSVSPSVFVHLPFSSRALLFASRILLVAMARRPSLLPFPSVQGSDLVLVQRRIVPRGVVGDAEKEGTVKWDV